VTFAESGYVVEQGLLAGPAGAADDVLLAVVNDADALVTYGSGVAPVILSGSDGTRRSAGVPIAGDDFPWLYPLPDVNADGAADYAAAVGGDIDQVSVRSGASGMPLWSSADTTGSFGVFVQVLGDATGDRRPDLLVIEPGFDAAGKVTAYQGDTGAALWSTPADDAIAVGDIDRDGVLDVETAGFSFSDNTFPFTARSGRTGKLLWASRVDLPVVEGAMSFSAGLGGDLDGDRVQDTLMQLDILGRHPRSEQIVVSGRNGHQRTFRSLIGVPLLASLDGRGDAIVDADVQEGRVVTTARTITRTTWRATTAVRGIGRVFFIDHGRLGLSGGEDVLMSATGSAGGDVLAMNGRTGAVRWRIHLG
jgi:hypothetical protein